MNNVLVVVDNTGEKTVVIPQIIFKGKRNISWKEVEKYLIRYNTRFALPVTNDDGEIVEYNIYQAVLIVRYSADGKLYLYDIQNIKKKRDAHHG